MTQSSAANKATGCRFRRAIIRDLPQMQKIYACVRALMAANGNLTQWSSESPRKSMIEGDIANQRTMLLVDTCNGHEHILAQFVLCSGEDPIYAKIDGVWLDNDAHMTTHRIAVFGLVHHAARDCTRWALKYYGNARVDTHPNNKAMRRAFESSGFARCGLIQLLDRPVDTIRIAYQRHEWWVWLSPACSVPRWSWSGRVHVVAHIRSVGRPFKLMHITKTIR